MTPTGTARLLSLLCALLWVSAEARAASFDYLYIVANEGGSSGGHTAIRFGSEVFHFQNRRGLLVLLRDRADDFFYDYALLDNRAIHASRVEVSEETRSVLADRFRRLHGALEAQLDLEEALRLDRILLDFLAERSRAPETALPHPIAAVPGLAYFDGPPGSDGERSPALDALRREIVRTHGSDSLRERERALRRELQALPTRPLPAKLFAPPTTIDQHPPFARTASDQWLDLRAALAALDVLERAPGLDPALLRSSDEEAFRLRPEEVLSLDRYARALSQQLVALLNSRGPDWGRTFLIGAARWLALRRSIESGSLVVLDSFGDASSPDTVRIAPPREGITAAILAETLRSLEAARVHFRESEEPDELAWERVEERANRALELLDAAENGGELRVARGHLVPSRVAHPPLGAEPEGSPALLDELAKQARRRDSLYSAGMRRLHRYELISRNCVTEIFEALNNSFDGTVETTARRLGGHVGGPRSLAFIPFISAQQVDDRYRVTEKITTLSYRQMRLREMRERENRWRVALRESNTWSAESYRRHPEDSFFIFFTDEASLLRPLFGSVNLIAGLGETVTGLLAAPFDRGATLARGLRGAFVSLPELAFFNIRKGTNSWVPEEHRSLETQVRWSQGGDSEASGARLSPVAGPRTARAPIPR